MPEAPTTQRSRGMRDLLPEEMERLRTVEDAFAATCRAWGYREIRTPAIEPLHLFTAAGTLSPRTLDRVYSFLDWDGWSGERVVLRPDSTIPAARLYAERLDGGRVAKLFYAQNVFRFTDDGSSREEWQCGVELIGDTGVAGDAELALLAVEALRAAGVGDLTVRLSHAGLVRAVLAAAGLAQEEQAAAYDRLLDGDLAIVDEVQARLPDAPLALLFAVEGAGGGFVANLRGTLVPALPALAAPLAELASTIAVLEARGLRPLVQPVLARSFEYYSGLVMKIDAGGRRVAIGGRYDELLGLVGGRAVPASGFALYLGSLLELLPAAPAPAGPRVVLRGESGDPALLSSLYDAAAALRASGFRAETVDGMHSAPTHRLTCRAAAPRFTLTTPATSDDFARIEDVVAALERAH